MNDGAKGKAPAAYLLRGAFGNRLTGYYYRPSRPLGQANLCISNVAIATLSTFVVRAGGVLTPVTSPARSPTRHADNCPASPPAQRGCARVRRRTDSSDPVLPPKKRRAQDWHPGLFRGQLVRRPMTSVVRVCVPVNSPAPARRSARGREGGRG